MQKFNKQAARRGARVCTRAGYPVRILDFELKDSKYPIVAVIEWGNDRESVSYYTADGRFYVKSDYGLDLMMADDDYLEKLERGEYGLPVPAPAPDPWDEFRREAALEMLRQRGGVVGDVVSSIIEDVNRMAEGLKNEKK